MTATRTTFLAWLVLFVAILIIPGSHVEAKLESSSVQQGRAQRIITDLFRENKLNEDQRIWGDRNASEITRYSKVLSMNFYQIFLDLGINGAMARCAVNAKNSTGNDYQRWLTEMERFDRAAEELGNKDRARYYVARGLLLLQTIPSKIQSLPEVFLKAAENGYPSGIIADHLVPGKEASVNRANASTVIDIVSRLAGSYRKGGYYLEAYKFYYLSLKAGDLKPETLVKMAECSHLVGDDKLSLITGLIFLDLFTIGEGGPMPHPSIIERITVSNGASAEDFAAAMREFPQEGLAPVLTEPFGVQKKDEHTVQKALNTFDERYLMPLKNNMGVNEDLLMIAAVNQYWNDTVALKRFLLKVSGPIDGSGGAVEIIARRVREDPRLAEDVDVAQWELRRWKLGGKLDQFKTMYPERAQRAGLE